MYDVIIVGGGLAARHIVSHTIYEHIKEGHKVYLDITEVENFSMQFPYIHSMCELLNITNISL